MRRLLVIFLKVVVPFSLELSVADILLLSEKGVVLAVWLCLKPFCMPQIPLFYQACRASPIVSRWRPGLSFRGRCSADRSRACTTADTGWLRQDMCFSTLSCSNGCVDSVPRPIIVLYHVQMMRVAEADMADAWHLRAV